MSKRPNKKHSLDEKQAVIESAKKNSNNTELAKQFNMPRSTIQRILKNKEATMKDIEDDAGAKRARLRPVKNDDLESALLDWIKSVRSQNVAVTGHLITEKAKELAALLGVEDFKGSSGWLEKFQKRHAISLHSEQGEAGNINVSCLTDWQQHVLQEALAEYSPEDVFNADETGLFWKMLPSKTLAFKGEKCTSGKKSKERITVLVGANMSGTQKLPLLVIGKSDKPRCFKNVQVPIEYTANKKAWMTTLIFEKWLRKWDCRLKQDGRKILLVLDNCSSHPHLSLNNIRLLFLPPNTTALSQPMDQGVIQNAEVRYRRFLLRKRIAAIDAKAEFCFNLLDALHLLRRSWSDVTEDTIANCFRHDKFVHCVEPIEQERDERINDELVTLWEKLQLNDDVEEGAELNDYLTADDELTTTGTRTLAEIAEAHSGAYLVDDTVKSEEEVVEMEPEKPAVTSTEAYKALEILRQYVEQNFADPSVLALSDKFDDLLAEDSMKNMKQTSITEYFPSGV